MADEAEIPTTRFMIVEIPSSNHYQPSVFLVIDTQHPSRRLQSQRHEAVVMAQCVGGQSTDTVREALEAHPPVHDLTDEPF